MMTSCFWKSAAIVLMMAAVYFQQAGCKCSEGQEPNASHKVSKAHAKSRDWRSVLRENVERGDTKSAIRDLVKHINLEMKKTDSFLGDGDVSEPDSIIRELNEDIKSNPSNAFAYRELGDLYEKMGDIDAAIQNFTKAIELEPDNFLTYFQRGDAYGKKGNPEAAIRNYTNVVELHPKLGFPYCMRGIAYLKFDRSELAMLDFNKAIELEPSFFKEFADKTVPLNPHLAYYMRAIYFFKKGSYGKAWQDVKKCQELGGKVDPNFLEKLRNASGRKR